MIHLSQSEENYLKSIFHLSLTNEKAQVSTNDIADDLNTKASSVTEMIKKLSDKKLLSYQKYKGSRLTKLGNDYAVKVIRKHRLWETFLVEKLKFSWDEVHEIAEQLEHIKSEQLTNRLSHFLNHPEFDPHGDPIPNEHGEFPEMVPLKKLKDLEPGESGLVHNIGSDDKDFLKYLTQHHIQMGSKILCKAKFEFDDSMTVIIDEKNEVNLSKKVNKNIFVK